FVTSKDFQESVNRLKPEFALVNSSYFNSMEKEYNWKPILAGHNNGSKSYSKILVVKKQTTSLSQLLNKSIAAVSVGISPISYINSDIPQDILIKSIFVVSVSKDIDGVMALGFDQVQGAIVTQSSFNKLKEINMEIYKELNILMELSPVEYPKFAAFPNASIPEKIAEVLKKIEHKNELKLILMFFGITGFTYEESMP
ncbi:MAG: PhnD/SsuA/transferrin family substrate-binding protein, partial [Desulfobacterales bacterium]|nr:PhnD/SsuA/transferrin family substrate-binding protein [Desulfobacterales bacterium]